MALDVFDSVFVLFHHYKHIKKMTKQSETRNDKIVFVAENGETWNEMKWVMGFWRKKKGTNRVRVLTVIAIVPPFLSHTWIPCASANSLYAAQFNNRTQQQIKCKMYDLIVCQNKLCGFVQRIQRHFSAASN